MFLLMILIWKRDDLLALWMPAKCVEVRLGVDGKPIGAIVAQHVLRDDEAALSLAELARRYPPPLAREE